MGGKLKISIGSVTESTVAAGEGHDTCTPSRCGDFSSTSPTARLNHHQRYDAKRCTFCTPPVIDADSTDIPPKICMLSKGFCRGGASGSGSLREASTLTGHSRPAHFCDGSWDTYSTPSVPYSRRKRMPSH